jgi:tripartite-type tricarboxylate transporter receptor subunit TctC
VPKSGIAALPGAAVGAIFSLTAAAADDCPSRPITLLHGIGVGGNADTIARIVADGLSSIPYRLDQWTASTTNDQDHI